MSVLRHLHGRLEEAAEPLERRAREQRERRQGIGGMLAERVPAAVRRAHRDASPRCRAELGVPAYLVGGFVRDLLLGRENRDLDVVVEGDGPAFARALARGARRPRARARGLPDRRRARRRTARTVDVASARSEFYRAPAVLPEVESSALRQDLYRRDFTINTMALRLGPGGAGGAGRLLRRPARSEGRRAARAAQPVVHRRPDAGAARGAAVAAPRLRRSRRRRCG